MGPDWQIGRTSGKRFYTIVQEKVLCGAERPRVSGRKLLPED
jgi:hypothetical protein